MTTLIAFVVTLGILILVHEWGHYRVARACGVKVLRFSIGFGKPLWTRRVGETEWSLGALPLGGYVKMLDEREGPVDPAERHRAFNRKSLWQRSAVVLAGPLANLVLAVGLYAASYWIGTEEPAAVVGSPASSSLLSTAGVQAGDRVRALAVLDRDDDSALGGHEWESVASLSDLRWQLTRSALDGQDVLLDIRGLSGGQREVLVPLSRLESREPDAQMMRVIGLGAPYSEPVLGEVVIGGPAAHAGLARGDRVLRVNGATVVDAASLRHQIRDSGVQQAPTPQQWDVQRGMRVLTLTVQPMRVEERGQHFGRIEAVVGASPEIVHVRYGGLEGLHRGWLRTGDMIVTSLKMFGRMLTGDVSVRNLSGPLTIADYAGQSAHMGLAYYLGFLAVVSVSLGVLNLLPLPMLDGGHLLYYLVEGVIGRPIPDAWIERLQRGGLVVILLMMSLALYNDVARLMGL